MIKARTNAGAVVLALEAENVRRLKEDNPIIVFMVDVSYPEAGITVITYLHHDGRYAMPPAPMRDKVQRTIALNDETIERLTALPVDQWEANEMGGIEMRVMIGDLAEIEQEMRKHWTPRTVVTSKGRSPSDATPSNN